MVFGITIEKCPQPASDTATNRARNHRGHLPPVEHRCAGQHVISPPIDSCSRFLQTIGDRRPCEPAIVGGPLTQGRW